MALVVDGDGTPLLVPADLAPFAEIEPVKAEAMIEDALAMAARIAPCINDVDFEHGAAARAILRGAILRWHEAGSGALQSEGIGAYNYTVDNRQQRKGMFWPSEIDQLQALCRDSSGAFSIDQIPASTGITFADRPDLWFQYYFPVPPDAP